MTIDKERVQELLVAITDTRNKKERMEYVAALRELLRPFLADLALAEDEKRQHE
jgi:hypothetical protein